MLVDQVNKEKEIGKAVWKTCAEQLEPWVLCENNIHAAPRCPNNQMEYLMLWGSWDKQHNLHCTCLWKDKLILLHKEDAETFWSVYKSKSAIVAKQNLFAIPAKVTPSVSQFSISDMTLPRADVEFKGHERQITI